MLTSLVLASVLGSVPAPTAVVKETVDAMTLRGMHVDVSYIKDCGFINAAYAPHDEIIWWGTQPQLVKAHTVVVCTEVLAEPIGFVRFVVAHEMSHAIVDQYNIPFTGSAEAAADELAAVVMVADGWVGDLHAAGDWHVKHPGKEDPADEHPSNDRRAFVLSCMADGAADDGPPACKRLLRRAVVNWTRLLSGGR